MRIRRPGLSAEAFPELANSEFEWFRDRFLGELNPFVGDAVSLLNGGLTKDNISRQVESVTFTTTATPSTSFADSRLAFKNKLGRKPDEVRLARVFPQGTADWTEGDWTTVTTFHNSWVTTAAGETPAYKMDASGFTCLRGRVQSGTVSTTTANGKIFTLPAAFRPSQLMLVPAPMSDSGTDSVGHIRIITSGEVVAYSGMAGGAGDFISLDGIRFPSATGTICAPIGQPIWDLTSDGSIRVLYVPGLRPNTKYELTVVIE